MAPGHGRRAAYPRILSADLAAEISASGARPIATVRAPARPRASPRAEGPAGGGLGLGAARRLLEVGHHQHPQVEKAEMTELITATTTSQVSPASIRGQEHVVLGPEA